MREPLLFSGLRWPGVKVVARRQVVDHDPDHHSSKVPLVDTLIIETSGRGRPYETRVAEGWWRDLAELALDDERRVLSFLQRRGDPLGQLAPGGKQISTHHWRDLKGVLERAVVAWDPQPDADGLSRFRVEKLRSAEHMFDRAEHPVPTDIAATGWARDLGAEYGNDITPTLRARTLAAYLCASAAASVRGGLDMRRCDYCSSWFTLHYANARQCSASCRAARFNNRRSPHGFLSQDHDPQGSDPVAEPVASAGNERQPAGSRAELPDQEGSGGARRADAGDRKPRRRRPPPA
jgi:hypothetical protein